MTPRLVLHTVTTTLVSAMYITDPTILGCALAVLTLVLLFVATRGESRRLDDERRERNAILRAGIDVAAAINRSTSSARRF